MDKLVPEKEYKELIVKKLVSVGLKPEESDLVANVLVHADMRGVRSHGTMRLEHYCNRIKAGGINLDAKYPLEETATAAGVIDAQGGMGHVAADIASKIGIKQAKEKGIYAISIKNTSHAGALSYFGEQAVDAGLISIAMANTDKSVTPYGAAEGYIGSNPIAFSYPGKKHNILLDMATSEGAFGKIFVARDNDTKIPITWAVDKDGVPTEDPHKALFLLPFGGHKGTGIALAIESLTGVAFGAFGPHIVSMYNELETQRNCSVFMLFIDPNIFGKGNDYYENFDKMIDELHALKPAPGVDKVLIPGEIELNNVAKAKKDGVPVYENAYKFMTS